MVIKMAPIIEASLIPKVVLHEIVAREGVITLDTLIFVKMDAYPLCYKWLVEQGVFKYGEQGYVGIV
jgi:hypothetical protein